MRTIASLRRFYSASTPKSSPSSLVHTHLPALTPYSSASALQESLRAQHLLFKSQSSPSSSSPSSSSSNPPPPFLISFESTPIYTFGRQQLKHIEPSSSSSSSISSLTQPLPVLLTTRNPPLRQTFIPDIAHTQRGGLTTYHGPGQLVLWPVIDIHSPEYPRFTVSSYAGFLEATTQRLLREVFAIETFISPDEPGVWVGQSSQPLTHHKSQPQPHSHQSQTDSIPPSQSDTNRITPRKIAALGVHHRRYITALGTAINIDIPTTGPPPTNPWARFVPCGIEGKGVTSVAREIAARGAAQGHGAPLDMPDLATRWAELFEEGLFDESKRGGR